MTNKQKPKRRHHHVWQHYLKPWTSKVNTIWCLQNGQIFSTGTSEIAVEKDFYRLHNFSHEDIVLMEMIFASGHPLFKKNLEHLLSMLLAPFLLVEQMKITQNREKLDTLLDCYASNVLEDYHASIEASFIPSLELALNEDISFYKDERCIPFLNYLSTQYMRTKGIKQRSIELCNADGSADLSRVWNVMIHMFATNIGASLFLERKQRRLILIHNRTSVPFITGDQPAVNLKGRRPHPPERLSIYYPISPQLALLLSDIDEDPLTTTEGLTASQASELNNKLFEASYKQVFALSSESLTPWLLT